MAELLKLIFKYLANNAELKYHYSANSFVFIFSNEKALLIWDIVILMPKVGYHVYIYHIY
jgi:hypothetical protein